MANRTCAGGGYLRSGRADDAGAASAATVVLERTSSMARWACSQTGCAGQWAFLEQDRPCMRQTLRQMEPSMASITSRIEAPLPRAAMRKPPACPRREEIRPARARACNTLERKLSGAPVARASREARHCPRPFARPTESSLERHNRRHASVASTNWFSSCCRPVELASRASRRRFGRRRSLAGAETIGTANGQRISKSSQEYVIRVTDQGSLRAINFIRLKLEKNSPESTAPARSSTHFRPDPEGGQRDRLAPGQDCCVIRTAPIAV